MTKGQAKEWVHHQLIVVEMGHDEVVAAFTALAERSPGTADRLKGLFRMCCEIVTFFGAVLGWGERRRARGAQGVTLMTAAPPAPGRKWTPT